MPIDPSAPLEDVGDAPTARQPMHESGSVAGFAGSSELAGAGVALPFGDGADGVGFGDVGDGLGRAFTFELPPGVPFDQPEHEVFTWGVALNADELIGLLGTLSTIITLPDQRRERVTAEARRLLRELLGVEGEVTVDVAFRADAWRSRHQ